MEILKTLLGYLTPLIALILGAWLFVTEWRRKTQSAIDADEAAAEDGRAWQRIKALLAIALPDIITDAENKYIDPGTGELKMSYAVAKIMTLIPPEWRGRIQDDTLQEFIEQALAGVKVIWDNIPRALHRVQIEQARADMEAEEDDAAGILTDAICEALCEAVSEEITRLRAEDEDALAEAVNASGEDGKRSLTFHLSIEVSSDADEEAENLAASDEDCLAEVTGVPVEDGGPAGKAEPAKLLQETSDETAQPRRKKRLVAAVEPVGTPTDEDE